MNKSRIVITLCSFSLLTCACFMKKTVSVTKQVQEEEVPPIVLGAEMPAEHQEIETCLLYTSDAADDLVSV